MLKICRYCLTTTEEESSPKAVKAPLVVFLTISDPLENRRRVTREKTGSAGKSLAEFEAVFFHFFNQGRPLEA